MDAYGWWDGQEGSGWGVEGGSAQLVKLHTPTLISDPQSISGQETRM